MPSKNDNTMRSLTCFKAGNSKEKEGVGVEAVADVDVAVALAPLGISWRGGSDVDGNPPLSASALAEMSSASGSTETPVESSVPGMGLRPRRHGACDDPKCAATKERSGLTPAARGESPCCP